MLLTAYAASGRLHDFYAFDEDGKAWDGSAFVTWADADYLTYRIAGTEAGTSGRFTATGPAGTVRYVLRFRGATLFDSYLAWEEVVAASPSVVTATAEAVWGHSRRTLTMTAAEAAAAMEPGRLSIQRTCSFEAMIPVGEDLSSADVVYFSLKRFHKDEDSEALVQITRESGLLVLMWEAATDATLGALTVNADDESVTLTLSAELTEVLPQRDNLVWDVKKIVGTEAFVVVEGTADVTTPVTRARA